MLLIFLSILLIIWVYWFGENQRIAQITPLEQPKKDLNQNSTFYVIDDYTKLVEDCLKQVEERLVDDYKTTPKKQQKRINSQELRHKEKVLKKRRILNKIASKSRQKNRKK